MRRYSYRLRKLKIEARKARSERASARAEANNANAKVIGLAAEREEFRRVCLSDRARAKAAEAEVNRLRDNEAALKLAIADCMLNLGPCAAFDEPLSPEQARLVLGFVERRLKASGLYPLTLDNDKESKQ